MKTLTILLALLLGGNVGAALKIKKEHIVQNQLPGYCYWVSLETLANHHGIKRLRGLKRRVQKMGLHSGNPYLLKSIFHKKKFKHYHFSHNQKIKLVYKWVDKGYGCVVDVYWCYDINAMRPAYHAIIVVDYDIKKKRIYFVNTNDRKVHHWSVKKFMSRWTGDLVAIWK